MKNKGNRYWTAFYTKPRSEKKAAEKLSQKGFEIYCPLRTVLRQWSDRKKKVKEPLFTSYVFAKVNEEERQLILKDQTIVSSVYWMKKPVEIRDAEISAIKEFLNISSNPDVLEHSFQKGEKLEIMYGPLKGEHGLLLRSKGSTFMLTLESIGYTLVAEVPKSNVKLAF